MQPLSANYEWAEILHLQGRKFPKTKNHLPKENYEKFFKLVICPWRQQNEPVTGLLTF